MTMILGIDIGGSKIAAGLVDESGTIHRLTRSSTPATDAHAIDAVLADLWHELTEDAEVHAVGLPAAGLIEPDQATVAFAPNIAWRHHPIAHNFKRLVDIDLPLIVENDANAAAWAEYQSEPCTAS